MVYAYSGVAPNRVFYAGFCSVKLYSCTSLEATAYTSIHESDGHIEIHLNDVPFCPTWNQGRGIIGLMPTDGILQNPVIAPGRDFNDQWAAQSEAWSFTPDTLTGGYSIDTIPYAVFDFGIPDSIAWVNPAGQLISTYPTLGGFHPEYPFVDLIRMAGSCGPLPQTLFDITSFRETRQTLP